MNFKSKNSNKSVNSEFKAISGTTSSKRKKNLLVILIVIVTIGLIFWVISLGKKAQETIPVVMINQNINKNQLITEDMLEEYDMLLGEYEKYSLIQSNGEVFRRVVSWEEKDKLVGMYAASSIEANTLAIKSQFITSRIDNTDSVMYSYPGKELIQISIGNSDINAFKTYIEPGDKLNIYAVYMDTIEETVDDGYGGQERVTYDVFRTEVVFRELVIADLLNVSGTSVLDAFTEYEQYSVIEQSRIEQEDSFQQAITPSSVLVALTTEEVERYLYYLSKNDVQFYVTLPQRSE